MGKPINTNYICHFPGPLDARTQVETYAGLALIAVKYIGLKVYVVDEDAEYRYYSTGWVKLTAETGGGEGVWGSITGDITDQDDLMLLFDTKFNVTGGTITGEVFVQSNVNAYNFILDGTGASTGTEVIPGEPVPPEVPVIPPVLSQYSRGVLESFNFYTQSYVQHTITNGVKLWGLYIECKSAHVLDGRNWVVGDKVPIPAQYNSENDDIRGVQIIIKPLGAVTIQINNIKVFGIGLQNGVNGVLINPLNWRLVIELFG